ncbi:hypothetical protein [Legionella waltersii]|uniref:Transcription regulator AsnC/Lrp ligand binding domain-containing protein n=1 Tax=Legionella waltersii TaxID=66969 RepID=A0A0W1A3P4_9GAMM|nr:hypothetical protein [Legionella waltersii]KTD75619.1 hypothetical protein Lwal_2557 [Legionella waltersii]SNV03107.1 Uncharacterised protein [Legionella waltersii]
MNTWNSIVFIKTKNAWSDSASLAKLNGVQNIWSTSGDWDWCVKLDSKHSTPDETSEFVKNLRKADWVADTKTSWWKEVSVR